MDDAIAVRLIRAYEQPSLQNPSTRGHVTMRFTLREDGGPQRESDRQTSMSPSTSTRSKGAGLNGPSWTSSAINDPAGEISWEDVVADVIDCVKVGGGSAGGCRMSTEARLLAGTIGKQGTVSTAVIGCGAAEGTAHTDMVGANETEGPRASKRGAGEESPEDDGGPNPWPANL